MNPVERFIFRISGINPNESMNWKQFLKAMLTINLLWLVYAMFMLIFQDKLPLNPDGNPGQTPDLAFNTAISFLVNCNLQHYSGESGLTYLTQLFVITFLQFLSAATGIACLVALFNGLKEKTTNNLGNFWTRRRACRSSCCGTSPRHRGVRRRGRGRPADLRARRRGRAAFLALLWPRLKDRRNMLVAVLAAAVALVLVPITAPGVPVLAAGGVAVLVGVLSERDDPRDPGPGRRAGGHR